MLRAIFKTMPYQRAIDDLRTKQRIPDIFKIPEIKPNDILGRHMPFWGELILANSLALNKVLLNAYEMEIM